MNNKREKCNFELIKIMNRTYLYFYDMPGQHGKVRKVKNYVMSVLVTQAYVDDWENIHFVLLSSSNRRYDLLSIV